MADQAGAPAASAPGDEATTSSEGLSEEYDAAIVRAFEPPKLGQGNTAQHSEVVPGLLYLASGHAVEDSAWMKEHGIAAVLNVAGAELGAWYPRAALGEAGVQLVELDMHDSGRWVEEAGQQAVCAVFQQAREAVRAATPPVLVHCSAGRSRSATVVLWVLLQLRKDWGLAQAWAFLRHCRPHAYPNIAFAKLLADQLPAIQACEDTAWSPAWREAAAALALPPGVPATLPNPLAEPDLEVLHGEGSASRWRDDVGALLEILGRSSASQAQREAARRALDAAGGDTTAALMALMADEA